MTEDLTLIETYSKAIDDPTLSVSIVLKGDIILNKALAVGEDFIALIKDLCKDKLCLGRVRSKDFEGSVYVFNGRVFATFFRSPTEELSGVAAFEKLKVLTKDLTASIIVYSFSKEVLGDVYEELVKSLKVAEVSVTPTPKEEVKELEVKEEVKKVEEVSKPSLAEVTAPTVEQILEKRVSEDVTSLGIKLKSLVLVVKEDVALAEVTCVDEDCSISDLSLVVVRNVIENNVKVSKVKLLLHVEHLAEKITSSEITLDDVDLWRALGYLPYVIRKYGSSIEEYSYTLKKNSLEIVVTAKTPPKLVHPLTIAKELYSQISKSWKGSLKIKVRMRMPGYGLEFLEGKAP
ncbi:MAG: hypothetical protein B7O98_03775 [Zestosphaera tikiterensis]|uniref:Uncharacterized protein n=1 Tax=Zestosphaera tikiterensis TaxID=1973259 RepID=A0A2R7Y7N7_9CREN|nr:MAG: hypothetical protein B7O98_03775 [Zestosphaera tikiterensis]